MRRIFIFLEKSYFLYLYYSIQQKILSYIFRYQIAPNSNFSAVKNHDSTERIAFRSQQQPSSSAGSNSNIQQPTFLRLPFQSSRSRSSRNFRNSRENRSGGSEAAPLENKWLAPLRNLVFVESAENSPRTSKLLVLSETAESAEAATNKIQEPENVYKPSSSYTNFNTQNRSNQMNPRIRSEFGNENGNLPVASQNSRNVATLSAGRFPLHSPKVRFTELKLLPAEQNNIFNIQSEEICKPSPLFSNGYQFN